MTECSDDACHGPYVCRDHYTEELQKENAALKSRFERLQDHYEAKMSTPQRVSVIEKERDDAQQRVKELEAEKYKNEDILKDLMQENQALRSEKEKAVEALKAIWPFLEEDRKDMILTPDYSNAIRKVEVVLSRPSPLEEKNG